MSLETFRAQKPSFYDSQEKTRKRHKRKYQYTRKIHRIRSITQIKILLNKDEDYEQGTNSYFGKIAGIEVKIDFSATSSCSLSTKTEGELARVYKEALRSLP